MPNDRTSRVLDELEAVTRAAPRPTSPAQRARVRSGLPVGTLSAASLIVVVVAVAAIALGRSGPAPAAGGSPAPSSAASGPAGVASPSVGSAGPSAVTCNLSARIVSWEGAAGQRIATVEMTNGSATDCLIELLQRPQLVDGDGNVLIDGKAPASSDVVQFAAGAQASTLVAIGNWCKPEPRAPISLAFVFGSGQKLVADPLSPTDLTLPPCNGATVPATISMHPWTVR